MRISEGNSSNFPSYFIPINCGYDCTVTNNYKKDFTGPDIVFKISLKYNPDLTKTQDYKQK